MKSTDYGNELEEIQVRNTACVFMYFKRMYSNKVCLQGLKHCLELVLELEITGILMK